MLMLSSTSRPVLRLLRMTLLNANDGYAFSVMWRRWRSSLSMWDDARVAVSACATVRALRVCGAAAVASGVALLAFSAVSAFAFSACASASACAACSSALSAASSVLSASSAVAAVSVPTVSRSASSAVSSITTLNCTDSVDSSSCSIWSALVGSLFSLTWIPPWSARLASSARLRRLPCLLHLRRFRHC